MSSLKAYSASVGNLTVGLAFNTSLNTAVVYMAVHLKVMVTELRHLSYVLVPSHSAKWHATTA